MPEPRAPAPSIVNLYLIRHAHAVEANEDSERPLSQRGREQVRSLAAFVKPSGLLQPAEFWHSPLLRSRETAELFARRLRLEVPHTVRAELQPESDPRVAARALNAMADAATADGLAIVGHEPHLSALATLLVTGRMDFPVFVMKKCSMLALEGAAGHWSVRWHVSPDLIQQAG